MQILPGSFSVPTDVTLKLSDGSIDAHRVILAAVSPVFEKMLFGDFKEGKSSEVALPNDSRNIMKLLIDFVYNGKCEVNKLDDIFPLFKVIDCYQMNKTPFQQMVGEAVLAKLDSSNYLTLLPKFASVMSEEASRKAAEKIIIYTNHGFIKDYDHQELPEEVLLPLLQTFCLSCYDVEIFDFLIKWHYHQTVQCGKSLKLTSQIFKCVRYSLIIPQILLSKVRKSKVVDKQLINDAICYIYDSTCPLGEYSNDDPCKPTPVQLSRKPVIGSSIEWLVSDGISIDYNHVKKSTISGTCYALSDNDYNIVKSKPLSDGIYSFSVSNLTCTPKKQSYGPTKTLDACFAITQLRGHQTHLYLNILQSSNLVTLYVQGSHIFVKYIAQKRVISTYTTSIGGPFRIHILQFKEAFDNVSLDNLFDLQITVHGKNSGV